MRSLVQNSKIFKCFWVLLVGFLFSGLSYADFKAPAYQGYVTDYAQLLTQEQRHYLTAVSTDLARQTTIQVATLVVPEMGADFTIESYANQVFEAWGIGQKGKDNGVLFILALQERKLRIEVGYGLEGVLTDGQSGALLDALVLPVLKRGDLGQGVVVGHVGICEFLADAYGVTLSQVRSTATRPVSHGAKEQELTPVQQAILLAGLILFIFAMIKSPGLRSFVFGMLLGSLLRGGGRSRSGGSGFGGFGGGSSGGGGSSRGF